MTTVAMLENFDHEFRRHKDLADRAVAQLSDAEFFARPADHVNSVAIIVKHLAGNLRSRWTDFLTSDGEKPDRNRDGEFLLTDQDTRPNLLAAWEHGWVAVFDTIAGLTEGDLEKSVTIRGEFHTVFQAFLRGVNHAAYHTGQIHYIVRMLRPDSQWLTIAPSQSRTHDKRYLGAR